MAALRRASTSPYLLDISDFLRHLDGVCWVARQIGGGLETGESICTGPHTNLGTSTTNCAALQPGRDSLDGVLHKLARFCPHRVGNPTQQERPGWGVLRAGAREVAEMVSIATLCRLTGVWNSAQPHGMHHRRLTSASGLQDPDHNRQESINYHRPTPGVGIPRSSTPTKRVPCLLPARSQGAKGWEVRRFLA